MGSKTGAGLIQAICALMPPHVAYVEPFLGSGAVLAAKEPSPITIGWDLSQDAINATCSRLAVDPRWKSPPRDVALFCGDGFTWLENAAEHAFMWGGPTVIYADPPYVLSTRGTARYEFDFTDDDHRRLAVALHKLAARDVAVILSGYPSALYDGLFGDWNTRELQTMTRGGVRTEKLWFNFEPGTQHWSTFAGRDFTDRQRIKRKAARWAAKFAKLPAAERQAVLAAVLAAGDHP